MEPFKVHILGCGSALPTNRHSLSAQVVEIRNKMFLVDCGEGTQIQLRRSSIAFNRISAVFISHLHGDHCFGLIGMLSTFSLLDRTAPLHIYAHAALEPMLKQQMELFCHDFSYEIIFHAIDTTLQSVIYEDRSLTVETIPLEHRVPCCGFLFREKPTQRHIRRDMIDFWEIPVSQISNIKAGADWITPDGETITNEKLTTPADPPRAYAYCSDTRYIPTLAQRIQGVNLLYHESTYAADRLDQAAKYHHSTAAQAAAVARDAQAGQLLLGHFSARYTDESVLLNEALPIFPNTLLSDEGIAYDVK